MVDNRRTVSFRRVRRLPLGVQCLGVGLGVFGALVALGFAEGKAAGEALMLGLAAGVVSGVCSMGLALRRRA